MTDNGFNNSVSSYHEPVLIAEIIELLNPVPGRTFLDATLGGGGHSEALAQRLQPGGTLIALDRDTDALQAAASRLAPLQNFVSIILIHTPFGNMEAALNTNKDVQAKNTNQEFIKSSDRSSGTSLERSLDGVLFDLGVSSHQLDTKRGFSFRRDEFVDMRMDQTSGLSVAALLQEASEDELEHILREYGEERWARRIARVMVERRVRNQPIETTAQLAEVVEQSIPRKAWPRDIHVATRTFQALRIAVNDELGQLESGLQAAIARLAPHGRIAVISYHSLEDRIVKHVFAQAAGTMPSAPGSSPAAFLRPDKAPVLRLLTRKPIVPTDIEIARNPRARSAKLRAAEKLPLT